MELLFRSYEEITTCLAFAGILTIIIMEEIIVITPISKMANNPRMIPLLFRFFEITSVIFS